MSAQSTSLLYQLLPRVSRSFYRDLRLGYLDQYRAAFGEAGPAAVATLQEYLAGQQHNPAERELLARLADCFALLANMEQRDQGYIRELVLTLTQGMQMDL